MVSAGCELCGDALDSTHLWATIGHDRHLYPARAHAENSPRSARLTTKVEDFLSYYGTGHCKELVH